MLLQNAAAWHYLHIDYNNPLSSDVGCKSRDWCCQHCVQSDMYANASMRKHKTNMFYNLIIFCYILGMHFFCSFYKMPIREQI